MILVDTSVWIDHLRESDAGLYQLLEHKSVLIHPLIIGEIAVGSFRRRDVILAELSQLPTVTIAADREVLRFISHHRLFGLGIGYIDAHILAAVKLTSSSTLWTRDKRLDSIAQALGLRYSPAP